VSEEEASFGLGAEEGQIVVVRKVEIAINIAALEAQVQDLLVRIVRDWGGPLG
jgi:hypothetical protein